MKWSLQELKNFYRKPLEFDEYVDASELKSLDKEIRDIPPVHVSGHADVNQQRATFYLNIQGEMTLPCANTLADVHFPFSIKTTEIFLLDPSYTVPVDEENLHSVEGHFLDLMPYIQEQILLEKPIKVVAGPNAPDKKAPPEGEGWQVVTEEDRKNRIDPRLADLAKFFDKDNS
ncbi:YceD family protein [Fictibacillus fluitans]|uniref:YceD family protein n=1 Tax=Fictibacillus fluitans TaxID=3058422 RepID=A0ABT8HRY2_9BACL|nr:YceD family protein [Fictibacillus sp. NE201]MDN4523533.1 YceD family protein [Fictibacillus sp. NE201]